jgi:ATP-dependent Lon protease
VIRKDLIMKELPILILDKYFLFPGCSDYLNIFDNEKIRRTIVLSIEEYEGRLIIVPSPGKKNNLNDEKIFPIFGSLISINLNFLRKDIENNIDLNSLKEVQITGLDRIKIEEENDLREKDDFIFADYKIIAEDNKDSEEKEIVTQKFISSLHSILEKVRLKSIDKLPYMTTMIKGDVGNLLDFISQNGVDIDFETRLRLLSNTSSAERLSILINIPNKKVIDDLIDSKTNTEIRKQQKEYYLKEKRRIIDELLKDKRKGKGNSETSKYYKLIEENPYPKYVKKVLKEELERYESTPSYSGESSIIKQYIEWIINLP